jgi:hypothetical protein
MISQPKQEIYIVPCKNKYTNGIINFSVIAFSFSEAVLILKDELLCSLEWIVGYGSM